MFTLEYRPQLLVLQCVAADKHVSGNREACTLIETIYFTVFCSPVQLSALKVNAPHNNYYLCVSDTRTPFKRTFCHSRGCLESDRCTSWSRKDAATAKTGFPRGREHGNLPGAAPECREIRWSSDLLGPFASAPLSTGWHAEILALVTLSIYGHLRHTQVPPSYLIQANWSPLSSSNRASRAALVQLPPPLLIHRLRNPPTSSPSAPLVIRLISTIGCDHTGGENRRARPPRDTWKATTKGSISPSLLFSSIWSTLVSFHSRAPALSLSFFFFFFWLLLSGYLRVNVGLNITAMTGKLAEKLPLTMSSLINTIPDSLYPEEDIPTSMNIFTNTESISHYSQMNTGKISILFFSFATRLGEVIESALCAEGNSCLPASSTCLRSWLLRLKVDSRAECFFGMKWHTANSGFSLPLEHFFFFKNNFSISFTFVEKIFRPTRKGQLRY